MSDPEQNFEFILKKNNPTRLLGLYSDNKQQNEHIYKPQDVLSSVSMQIKAIQVADSLKTEKCVVKDLQKFKKSNFLSVNNLPMYEEVPKPATKFDTQCVSDTQLINIIDDAEIIDIHQGMTEEFETTFCHYTEKQNLVDIETADTKAIHVKESNKEFVDKLHDHKATITDSDLNNVQTDNCLSISPIMCSNNVRDEETSTNGQESKKDENSQVDENSVMVNECIEIENDRDMLIERPLSPIFMHRNVKTKSKTPSPLIFNLDKFEQFENIVIPILEVNDFKMAKQVINSQILDKELHIKMDEEIQLNERDVLSPVGVNKNEKKAHSPIKNDNTEFKTHTAKDPHLDTDLEFIELDKATSNALINEIMKENSTLKVGDESEKLEDEILFSSDEEDIYAHKSYQDLPFTCALETSFYNQSDVLDKTMFVGFQTASNKSIQIFTESFTEAKSILSDVITITDLVKHCDSNVKKQTQENQVNVNLDFEDKEFKLGLKNEDKTELKVSNATEEPEDLFPISNNIKASEEPNFEGFMTASKKVIRLSQKALSRCKKVFQDIDLNEKFDTQTEEAIAVNELVCCEDKISVTDISNKEAKTNTADDDIQNIDDIIIEEFENIEMSLEEDKESDKDVTAIGFKTASNKDIQISETAITKIKDVFKDINFEEDFTENDIRQTNIEEDVLPKIMECPKLSNDNSDINLGGFKTASNKNISITKEAFAKTKTIFQNLDSTEFPRKSSDILDKEDENLIDLEQPSTSKACFGGFKTANNKNIKISKQALAKSKTVLKDIGTTEEKTAAENIYDQPSTSKISFVGFKTANNRHINIPKDALAKTKKIFEGIDCTDLKLSTEDAPYKKISNKSETLIDLNQPSTSKPTFVGFKTANNKNIKISNAALAKTKDVFKDIDSTDFKFPEKGKKLEEEMFIDDIVTKTLVPTTSFVGFKTANNKDIKISDSALTKSKNILQDIDSDNFKCPSKLKGNINKRIDKDDSLENDTMDVNKPSRQPTFTGFKTANNKEINISKEALAKTKNIFDDIDTAEFKYPDKSNNAVKSDNKQNFNELPDFNHPSTSKAGFMGFKTANNRMITISKDSLTRTVNIFKDIDTDDIKISEKVNNNVERENFTEITYEGRKKRIHESKMVDFKSGFVAFKTANNKNINISEDSLAKTKKLFKDIDSSEFVYPKKSSKELKEKSNYPDIKEPNYPSTSKSNFVGFKTANNKVINISDTALAKTKNIFKNIDSTEFEGAQKVKEDYPNIEIDDIEANSNKETESENRNTDFKEPVNAVPKFQGFVTANNKPVKVSADALVKSRKIFQDLSQKSNNVNKNIENKDVYDTVKKSLPICKETGDSEGLNVQKDIFCGNSNTSPVFKGFQTANKKPVTISEEALAKSRKLFEGIDDGEDLESEFRGFKTANNKKVEVSQKALIETKKQFEDAIKSSFKGFQTGNDKKVLISEESLAKSRKIFQDLEKNEIVLQNNENKAANIKFGFKTGTNRDVTVSDEAIARSKRKFSEIDDSDKNIADSNKDKGLTEDTIANIIDTQVLNNFDESLHTEDFHESPIKSKRSGSPILSCPRAKKRKKFETPYSQKILVKEKKKVILENKDTNNITFTEHYKKMKKYTLKDLAKLTEKYKSKTDPYLLKFSFDNLLKFTFNESRNDLSNGDINIDSLKYLFSNSVNSKLIPKGWLNNHLKLILWKLISYEIKFKIPGVCTARNVIDQLKYRYDKELYNAQRPTLRKILEKDDVASKTMVLCVAAVYVDGVSVASATTTDNIELLVTDGWYCIKASIDKMLAQLVCQGKIVVGTKIVTNGAELVNCEQGISPWEDTSAVRLKIFGNSTRRARWDARLGYHGNAAILSQLSSVKLDGGKVSKLRVFVTRVYPALYVEKFENGSTVTRSERLEHLHQMKTEAERQIIMEKIYEEVEKEFSDQESQDSESLSDLSNKRTCLDSGSQIAKVMKRSKDPGEFRAGLTTSQSRLLEAHTTKKRDILLQDIQKKVREKMEKAGVCTSRNVVTLLKIRVAGVMEKSGVEITKGMMSIWKPTDAVLEIITEGAWIDVMNVVPTALRYSEIQISAGRQSVFSISKYKEPEKFKHYTKLLKRSCFTIKDLAQNPSMATDYNEIDTVGFIFLIDPSMKEFDSTKQPFQNVFVADADKNMICINFWGGLKKFGFQNVLDTGQIVACANLQKRAGNTRKSIPQYRVTEFSYFTKTPKNENARNVLDDLSKKFLSLDRRKFCDDCIVLKNNYAVIKHNNENISPYRFNNTDHNISKNKMFIDSPLARPNKFDDNFNLTGLDFESTFKQTDTQNLSEEVLLRKRKVNEKIARLKMYGEPPPLSTIHIINRSKHASNSYKSPLNLNNNNSKIINQKSKSESAKPFNSDSSSNVASVTETPEKGANLNDSDMVLNPVLMNRTYVKSVNPVKIDFDVKDNNDSIDHFAEEFDGSPPLSLD